MNGNGRCQFRRLDPAWARQDSRFLRGAGDHAVALEVFAGCDRGAGSTGSTPPTLAGYAAKIEVARETLWDWGQACKVPLQGFCSDFYIASSLPRLGLAH